MTDHVSTGRKLRYAFDKSMAAGPIALVGWLALVIGLALATALAAPEWWEQRGVLAPEQAVQDDRAAVTVGQIKLRGAGAGGDGGEVCRPRGRGPCGNCAGGGVV